jgi:hypothetical protein
VRRRFPVIGSSVRARARDGRAVALAAALAWGCGSTGPAAPAELRVTSDSASYGLDSLGNANGRLTIVNLTQRSFYFQGCVEPIAYVLQLRQGGSWVNYSQYGDACQNAVLPADTTLAAGDSLTVAFFAWRQGDTRIKVLYAADAVRPFSRYAFSNAFTVR